MRMLAAVCAPIVLAGSAGCGPSLPEPSADLPRTTSTDEAFPGLKCSAVRPQTEPDLMGWDSGSRANLNSLRRQGVIAVRYDAKGCNVELEVLSNCIGKGTYAYEPYPSSDTKMARNASELFAELPLGAARLSGRIKAGRALRTDYMLAGVASLPVGGMFARTNLSGDCARATHVISRVYLGGFGMFAGEVSAIEAQASLFGAGAGGATEAKAERVALEGNPAACETAQKDGNENKLCAVPLRIGLLALDAPAQPAAPVAPAPATAPPVAKDPVATKPSGAYDACVASGKCDRDGDGNADATDKCPDVPEDRDLFEDEDGCPEADNDRDKIADAVDKCPMDPETYNGFQDEDGCPDKGLAVLTPTAIQIKERVSFEPNSAKVSPSSFGVLGAVAAVLKANPLVRVVVEGHTDDRGSDAFNLKLSEQRAQAVADNLVGQGVERSRLTARGWGETKPIASNSDAQGRALNNRVEFIVESGAPRTRDRGF